MKSNFNLEQHERMMLAMLRPRSLMPKVPQLSPTTVSNLLAKARKNGKKPVVK